MTGLRGAQGAPRISGLGGRTSSSSCSLSPRATIAQSRYSLSSSRKPRLVGTLRLRECEEHKALFRAPCGGRPKYVGQERDDISWVLPPFVPPARAPTGNQQDALHRASTSALLHFAVAQVTEAAEYAIDMGTAPARGSTPPPLPSGIHRMSEELCVAEQELRQKPELLYPHESYFTPLGSRYSDSQ